MNNNNNRPATTQSNTRQTTSKSSSNSSGSGDGGIVDELTILVSSIVKRINTIPSNIYDSAIFTSKVVAANAIALKDVLVNEAIPSRLPITKENMVIISYLQKTRPDLYSRTKEIGESIKDLKPEKRAYEVIVFANKELKPILISQSKLP